MFFALIIIVQLVTILVKLIILKLDTIDSRQTASYEEEYQVDVS